MTGLRVAPKLTLPVELVTQKNAILAMSGAGKSNTAVVLAEEMHDAGVPWVAIDPKGDWWGIRSDADGTGAGLPIPVFGGLHGDIPLEPTAGKLIGNVIAEQRLTCVLDVSEFDSKAQQMRFLTDLAETLLKRNRDPLHLFLEEADDYLPQRVFKDQAACVGAWQRVVKRGRFRGLGCTLITQRSAALNKDALNQVDTLIPMRVTAPRDRKAIEEWVEAKALGKELVDSLPELENGEAWIWSPQALKKMERVHFRRRRTFDSGETPVLGAKARPPATLADVDLDAIKDEMAATIEKAAKTDPARLTARIRELERELTAARAEQPEPEVQTVEVPVVPPEAVVALNIVNTELHQIYERIGQLAAGLLPLVEKVDEALDVILQARGLVDAAPPVRSVPDDTRPRSHAGTARGNPPRAAGATAARGAQPPAPTDTHLRSGAIRLLQAIARWPDGCTRAVAATTSGFTKTGGTFGTYVGDLKRAGYITVTGDHLRATDAGQEAAGVDEIPTNDPDEVLGYWRTHLRGGAVRMLDTIAGAGESGIDRVQLAEAVDMEPTGGTFGTYLGDLRRAGLIVTEGSIVRLEEWLL